MGVSARTADLQFRAATKPEESPGTVYGFAAVYNSFSKPLEGRIEGGQRNGQRIKFVEKIEPGAFAAHLRTNPEIIATVDHIPTRLLANSQNNSLRMFDSAEGLRVEIDMPNTQFGKDTFELVRSQRLRHMSFWFDNERDQWPEIRHDGYPVRIMKQAEIIDVSLTALPAYPATTADVRTLIPAGRIKSLNGQVDAILRVRQQLLESGV